jgi:peptide-methionine (S)-S-oxide reductase
MLQIKSKQRFIALVAALSILGLTGCQRVGAADAVAVLPDPAVDAPRAAAPAAMQSAVFAGGCFWGVQAVFQHLKGVQMAVSGYAGGASETAKYEQVGSGRTGHAESVQVTYNPAQISYGQLLKVFFAVAHDPTQVNRQGPDVGTQYRSALFFTNDEQRKIAQAYVAQLQSAKAFSRPIATQMTNLPAFYPAEAYHQDYATLHPDNPYIAINDAPKVTNLRDLFPGLYLDHPAPTPIAAR